MIAYGEGVASRGSIFSWSMPSLDDVRLAPNALPSPHFACLLVCDAHCCDDEAILLCADRLLASGLSYFCAWGPDCERVHDLVDQAIIRREVGEDRPYPVMTTWHGDETLEDAIWYILNAAHPDETYGAMCKSRLVISIGNDAWDSEIQTWLRSVTHSPDMT